MMFLPFKWCPNCGTSVSAGGFCRECKTLLTENKNTHTTSNLNALYRYQGILRSTILRAKVNNENTAFASICDLFTGHPDVISQALACDFIVPTPSSLWGRLRGKYDLAQGMALALAKTVDRPVGFFPWSFYFRRKKRAGVNLDFATWKLDISSTPQTPWRSKSIFLIDDIITTGATLNELRSILENDSNKVVTMALASAHES